MKLNQSCILIGRFMKNNELSFKNKVFVIYYEAILLQDDAIC